MILIDQSIDINQGLDSLPPAAVSALLQPPLVKTIPEVTTMGGLSEEEWERIWELSDEFERLRRNSTIAANCNESQTNVAPVPFGGEYSW